MHIELKASNNVNLRELVNIIAILKKSVQIVYGAMRLQTS